MRTNVRIAFDSIGKEDWEFIERGVDASAVEAMTGRNAKRLLSR